MGRDEEPQVTCSYEGCNARAFNEEHSLHQGWVVVELGLYCPLHGYSKGREVQKRLDRELLEGKVAARAANEEAKRSMTTGEYAAWFGFQQDLIDYRREHGEAAPKQLVGLSPRDWLKIHRSGAAIDVESEVEAIQNREKAAQATREWLARRV